MLFFDKLFTNFDYSSNVKRILQKIGNKRITSLRVGRVPVANIIIKSMNIVSFGKFSKNFKDKPYDKIYHTFIQVNLDNKTFIVFEKNEVICAHLKFVIPKDTSFIDVSTPSIDISLNKFLLNAQKFMGDKYWTYSGRDNNCQDYIIGLLKSNNFGNEDVYKFIKQDTNSLFEDLTTLCKISNTIIEIVRKSKMLMETQIVLTTVVITKLLTHYYIKISLDYNLVKLYNCIIKPLCQKQEETA
jgi:hypothetical protein